MFKMEMGNYAQRFIVIILFLQSCANELTKVVV